MRTVLRIVTIAAGIAMILIHFASWVAQVFGNYVPSHEVVAVWTTVACLWVGIFMVFDGAGPRHD